MQVTFVGCGDAFGSGGRFNTCFHVRSANGCFLIDCGASSMIALKSLDFDPNEIDTILITHFHGDHFGGLPYLMLDAQFFSKRREPLTILGPEGLEEWFARVMEATFPGSSCTVPKFDLNLQELVPGRLSVINGLTITTARVRHGHAEGPFHAYRINVDDKILAYTGDTEWVDELIEIGRDADLLIAEAYFFEKKVPLHMDLATLESKLPVISPKRLILTHMNDDMLSRANTVSHECAYDGLSVDI
ncbi:MAG: MBL fold metallo-hydrolase [Phyllobacteriaceae bacterium]|nr:MBL fold metallo-hydrolase [Phyllobacteriaceae bacterium]